MKVWGFNCYGVCIVRIEKKDIETQEQLLQELDACGFSTTQATISRDIKELRIIKELSSNKIKKASIKLNKKGINRLHRYINRN